MFVSLYIISTHGIFNDCYCSDHQGDDIDSINRQQSLNDYDDISIHSADPCDSEFNMSVE